MIVKNRRRVDFYTHVVATTPEDSSSPRRIWRYGERSFPSMRIASFRGFFTFGRRSRGRRRDLFKLPNDFFFSRLASRQRTRGHDAISREQTFDIRADENDDIDALIGD